MKKMYKLFLLASCAAVCAISCEKSVETIENETVEPIEEVQKVEPQIVNISVPFPAMESSNGTKVTMNPTTGATQWVAGDKIVIYGLPEESDPTNYVVHEISAGEIVDPTVANISVDVSAIGGSSYYCDYRHYSIAYPADDWSYYSKWSSDGRGAFSNTNQILLGGYISNDLSSATLFNLTAAIVFKVSGNYDSYYFFGNGGDEVVGYSRYVYNMNASTPKYIMKYGTATYGTLGDMTTISGAVNGDGSTYNFIYIPQHHKDGEGENESEKVTLESGFTIQFVKNGVVKGYVTSTKGLTLEPGHYIDLGVIPAGAIHTVGGISAAERTGAEDLSDKNGKSANCYIVDASDDDNESKVFKFRAVKGNSYVKDSAAGTSVGDVDDVVLLWETYNDNTSVTPNSVISKVDYADGFVYFKMPETLHAGNAVIAAKDDKGTILWSWHIWVPATSFTVDDFGISSVNLMSRNLGALDDTKAYDGSTPLTANVVSYGLYYQWGRKDPFVGPQAYNSGTMATVSGTAWTLNTTEFSLAESYGKPTQMARFNSWNTSASDSSVDDTWGQGGGKTINDPCPPGYRVPKYNSSDPIWKDVTTLDAETYKFEANTTYYWWKLGTAVFPLSGWMDSGSSAKTSNLQRGKIWSAGALSLVASGYPEYGITQYIYYDSVWKSSPGYGTRRQYACNIRCAVE